MPSVTKVVGGKAWNADLQSVAELTYDLLILCNICGVVSSYITNPYKPHMHLVVS